MKTRYWLIVTVVAFITLGAVTARAEVGSVPLMDKFSEAFLTECSVNHPEAYCLCVDDGLKRYTIEEMIEIAVDYVEKGIAPQGWIEVDNKCRLEQ